MKSPKRLPLELRISAVHGTGAFAIHDMPEGTVLGSYEGRRFTEEEAKAAEVDWNSELTYLFALSDGSMIDGAQGGNATRHINHSCEPNCEAYEVRLDDDSLDLRIRTLVAVHKGDELFIDYALIVADEPASAFPCYCQSSRCRGTMVAVDN